MHITDPMVLTLLKYGTKAVLKVLGCVTLVDTLSITVDKTRESKFFITLAEKQNEIYDVSDFKVRKLQILNARQTSFKYT